MKNFKVFLLRLTCFAFVLFCDEASSSGSKGKSSGGGKLRLTVPKVPGNTSSFEFEGEEVPLDAGDIPVENSLFKGRCRALIRGVVKDYDFDNDAGCDKVRTSGSLCFFCERAKAVMTLPSPLLLCCRYLSLSLSRARLTSRASGLADLMGVSDPGKISKTPSRSSLYVDGSSADRPD